MPSTSFATAATIGSCMRLLSRRLHLTCRSSGRPSAAAYLYVRCQCSSACTSFAATERGACALPSIGSPLGRCLGARCGSPGSPRASHRRRPSPLATARTSGPHCRSRTQRLGGHWLPYTTFATAATIAACLRPHSRRLHLTWRSSGRPPAAAYLYVRCQCCEACTSFAATERGACALSSIGSPLGRCLGACCGSPGSPRASHHRRRSPLATV